MLTEYEDNLLKRIIKSGDYVADVELADSSSGNYIEVKAAITNLLSEGKIVKIGSQYDKEYKKIFPLYTWLTAAADNLCEKVRLKQYNSQKKQITENLLKKLKESGNLISVKQEQQMIKTGTQKIQPKFFQLNNDDILSCYSWVVANGAKELTQREKLRKLKEEDEIRQARSSNKRPKTRRAA